MVLIEVVEHIVLVVLYSLAVEHGLLIAVLPALACLLLFG